MRATLTVPIALVAVGLVLAGLQNASATDQLEPRGRIIFEGCGGYCSENDLHANRADLYRLNLRTGSTTQLTRTPGSESEPAVSANGAWLVYSRNDKPGTFSKRHQLWLSRTDGSNPRQLTPNGSSSTSPAWFRSGLVYFTREEGAGPCTSIFRVRATGGAVERVLRQKGDESLFQPSVSNDGRIAFGVADCEVRHGCCDIDVVDSRGRQTDDLESLPGHLEATGRPAWSPDGEMIAFESGFDPGIVWVARRDGSQLGRVSPGTLSASGPTWSPDGEWIAFDALRTAARAPYTTDIYVARVDGSDLRRLTRTKNVSESSPAWTP
jgi:Tol biopolymer transport system component